MTLDEIEQNVGKWVFYSFSHDDLPDFDEVHISGVGIIIGIKQEEDTKYRIYLNIEHYGLKDKEYEFSVDEIKFIVPDNNAKIFKLLL